MPLRLSASQLKTFQRCERRWGWEKLVPYERQETEATLLGTRCHLVWEAWLRHGTDPKEEIERLWPDLEPKKKRQIERICRATLSQLPHPGVCQIEGEFWLKLVVDGEEILIKGFVDGYIPDQGKTPHPYLGPTAPTDVAGVPLVLDHKSTKDVDEYAIAVEDLPEDIQGGIYGGHALTKQRDASHVDLFWSYSQKTATKPHPVRIRVSRDQVDSVWRRIIIPLIQRVIRAKNLGDPLKLAPTEDACGDYGGCPHRAKCSDLTPKSLGDYFGGTMSLLSELQAKDTTAPKTEAVASITPPDVPEPTPAPQTEASLPAKTKAKRKPAAKGETIEDALQHLVSRCVDAEEFVTGAALLGVLAARKQGQK